MVLFGLAKVAVKYTLIGCGILYLMQSCESKKQTIGNANGLEKKVIVATIAKADTQQNNNLSEYLANTYNVK